MSEVKLHWTRRAGMADLIERTRMAAKILRDIGGQSAMAETVEEAAAALEAAREDGWRVADEPPDGAMGCWTEDVITVSNHGTVCTIAYFHDPVDGVWQRPGRYVSGEEVVMWRPLPAIDQACGNGGGGCVT